MKDMLVGLRVEESAIRKITYAQRQPTFNLEIFIILLGGGPRYFVGWC